jgi:hypothetical protein
MRFMPFSGAEISLFMASNTTPNRWQYFFSNEVSGEPRNIAPYRPVKRFGFHTVQRRKVGKA